LVIEGFQFALGVAEGGGGASRRGHWPKIGNGVIGEEGVSSGINSDPLAFGSGGRALFSWRWGEGAAALQKSIHTNKIIIFHSSLNNKPSKYSSKSSHHLLIVYFRELYGEKRRSIKISLFLES
jgi:hypothetical protein